MQNSLSGYAVTHISPTHGSAQTVSFPDHPSVQIQGEFISFAGTGFCLTFTLKISVVCSRHMHFSTKPFYKYGV